MRHRLRWVLVSTGWLATLAFTSLARDAVALPPPVRPESPPVPREGVIEIVPPAQATPPPPTRSYPPPSDSSRDRWRSLDRTLDVSLSLYHRRLRLPGEVGPTWGGDNRVGGLRASGDIGDSGFSIRGAISLDGVRFGAGAGLSAPSGLRVEDRGEAREGRLTFGRAFGTPVEVFVGYAHGFVENVRPFVELRGSAALLHVAVGAGDSPGQSQTIVGASFGARGGVVLFLNHYLFAEAGLGVGFVGADRFSASASLGLPIPLSHL